MKVREAVKGIKMSLLGKKSKKKPLYQDTRFPQDQFEAIIKSLGSSRIGSILEVGCNQGRLLRMFKEAGNFCVGVDLNPYWKASSADAALGVYPVDEDLIDMLPVFDGVLLLSVHHQWVKKLGDERAQKKLKKLSEHARKVFFVEFSALAKKYGYTQGERFIDNDEETVVAYAISWLEGAGFSGTVYVGKNREFPPVEPYRYLFRITPTLSEAT